MVWAFAAGPRLGRQLGEVTASNGAKHLGCWNILLISTSFQYGHTAMVRQEKDRLIAGPGNRSITSLKISCHPVDDGLRHAIVGHSPVRISRGVYMSLPLCLSTSALLYPPTAEFKNKRVVGNGAVCVDIGRSVQIST